MNLNEDLPLPGEKKPEEMRQLMRLPAHLVHGAWCNVFPLLYKSKEFWTEEVSHQYVFNELMNDRMQLWLMNDEQSVLLAALTVIKQYDKSKILYVLCVGGMESAKLIQFGDYFMLWCRREGVSKIRIEGRPAWKRILKGFDFEEKIVLEKDISHIREH